MINVQFSSTRLRSQISATPLAGWEGRQEGTLITSGTEKLATDRQTARQPGEEREGATLTMATSDIQGQCQILMSLMAPENNPIKEHKMAF